MEFDQFLREICPSLELNWKKYRRRSSRHRVLKRMEELGIDDYSSYLHLLQNDPKEADELPDLMRVTVSRFFREKDVWTRIKDELLPEIISDLNRQRPLTALSVGCSSGEEPYTLAMIWLQYIRPHLPSCYIEIVGIDLDETVLARAENALYEVSSLREVPQEIRKRFFEKENHLFRLSQEVKNMVQFKRLNFMRETLPQEMDLIFCRYLPFTYYTKKRRHKAAKRLWHSIRAGGFLVIGKKEDLCPDELKLFEPWEKSWVIFRKKP